MARAGRVRPADLGDLVSVVDKIRTFMPKNNDPESGR